LNITIICSDRTHKIFSYLEKWKANNANRHKIRLTTSKDVEGGDILFLISCTEIIDQNIRNKFKKTLVIHESDLPKGRGWSPMIWQILEGSNIIPITLLEAEDKVDSGAIWQKKFVKLEGHETSSEINSKIFPEKIKMIDFAIEHFDDITPSLQENTVPTYFLKRTSKDSEIDVEKPISKQFNLLRIADPERYPCFFRFRNHKYKISIEKINDDGV
jgi:methionyl-tRNA formyltransferase